MTIALHCGVYKCLGVRGCGQQVLGRTLLGRERSSKLASRGEAAHCAPAQLCPVSSSHSP